MTGCLVSNMGSAAGTRHGCAEASTRQNVCSTPFASMRDARWKATVGSGEQRRNFASLRVVSGGDFYGLGLARLLCDSSVFSECG